MRKRIIALILMFGFGWLIGPILAAIIGAQFYPAKGLHGINIEAAKLVETYQSNLPSGRLFLSIHYPDKANQVNNGLSLNNTNQIKTAAIETAAII